MSTQVIHAPMTLEYLPNEESPIEIKAYCEIPPHQGRFNAISMLKQDGGWVVSSSMAIPSDMAQASAVLACIHLAFAAVERLEKLQQHLDVWKQSYAPVFPKIYPRVMSSQKILFGDLETGGLCERLPDGTLGAESLPIFELAFILTDADLNEIAEPLRLVIHQPEEVIAKCDQWAIETHTKSGLLDEVRASTLTLADAERQIIDWLTANGIAEFKGRGSSGLWFGGNSILLDRNFIMAQMPNFHAFMHYRQFDVSMLAMAARLWAPEVEKEALGGKQYRHEALADIRETIQELKVYAAKLFGRG